MSVNIENLHVGDFVALCQYRGETPTNPWTGQANQIHFDGLPFEVVSISPPFIALLGRDGGIRPLDTREWGVTKVNRHYAKKVMESHHHAHPAPFSSQGERTRQRSRRRRKTKPDKGSCPRCGSSLIQRMVGEGGPDKFVVKGWFLYCEKCGYNGGPVEEAV